MNAYVITLRGNEYSERVAARCVNTARTVGGIEVQRFDAVGADMAREVMQECGLEWTWGKGGAGMVHHSYGGDENARIGCAMSHYVLWSLCADSPGPMLILEHDAVFVREFVPFESGSACMINDPLGATPRGDWWSEQMQKRGPGVWPKTKVFDDTRPDGLAGNSAYIIKPHAARQLIELVDEIGLWPNDAIMCRQLVPGLQEVYPFFTEVQDEESTIR